MGSNLTIVGGGLAGSEAAWQAAEAGVVVNLFEMRPVKSTPAHETDQLAELVCSNSLGSSQVDRSSGLLKAELRGLNSLILQCAEETAVPAGSSLAVDRNLFSQKVTEKIEAHPRISIIRKEVDLIPDSPVIIASGPLTSDRLTKSLQALSGEDYLYFYDAVSPIVLAESIDMNIAFRDSRYNRGELDDGDYINCPMNKAEFQRFYHQLIAAETITLKKFEEEDPNFFAACMPIEVMAGRGPETLTFGPMRPVGLSDPRSSEKPYAIVQLRQDNLAGSLYNIVGFQTNLKWGDQKRVLRLIPGLEKAEFQRYGMMHRNTYINAPRMLQPTMQFRNRADLFFAGQITGVEGYIGNAGTGLVAGINASRLLLGKNPVIFPTTTMLGALCHYVTHARMKDFQPMKANFGLFSAPTSKMTKRERYTWYAKRSLTSLRRFTRDFVIPFNQQAAEQGLS